MNLTRIVQPFLSFLDTVDKRFAIWQLEQELACLEYEQSFSERPSNEGYVLAAIKLRNDLDKLKGS